MIAISLGLSLVIAASFALAALRGAEDNAALESLRVYLDSVTTTKATPSLNGWVVIDVAEFTAEIDSVFASAKEVAAYSKAGV